MPTTLDVVERPLRLCSACGGLDDHPRHVILVKEGTPEATPTKEFLETLQDGVPATALAELLKGTVVVRHLDCCAAAGCTVCQETEEITGGARGQELIELVDPARQGALADHDPEPHATNKELGIDG